MLVKIDHYPLKLTRAQTPYASIAPVFSGIIARYAIIDKIKGSKSMSEKLVVQTHDKIHLDESANTDQKTAGLDTQSDQIVTTLFALDATEVRAQQQKAMSIRELGADVQREIYKRSALLKQPMSKLVNDAEDGGEVANALLALQENTAKINPDRFDFDMGTLRRLLSMIPGIGTPLSRWFAQYQSVEGVIQTIVKSLEDGQQQLKRDNTTLKDDQLTMRELTIKLEHYIELGSLLDKKITAKLAEDTTLEQAQQHFIEEDVLFPLRQRILDLQQQLAVNQQGILTTEVIVRNNRELIRGVSRSLNVTVSALNIAATLALALQSQKKVLKGVEAINKTTDDLLAQTASKLKTQGVDIHKQASSAQLNVDKLKAAFADVDSALHDMSIFRREALPQMSQSIDEMSQLTASMGERVEQLKSAENAHEHIVLDV